MVYSVGTPLRLYGAVRGVPYRLSKLVTIGINSLAPKGLCLLVSNRCDVYICLYTSIFTTMNRLKLSQWGAVLKYAE